MMVREYLSFLAAILLVVLQNASAFIMLPRRLLATKLPYRQQMSTQTNVVTIPQATEPTRIPSFVQDEMKPYSMKLHTRDQAREGEQPAQTPFTVWEPSRQDYFQFLVDSLVVYEALDSIVDQYEVLAPFRHTGLERTEALKKDIIWMQSYDPSIKHKGSGPLAKKYAEVLRGLAAQSIPKFICHYYNHYFAHTAGGRMIGKKMCTMLLDGHSLKFYEWDGDMKVLIEQTKHQIDLLALTWSAQDKKACLEETLACFKYGGDVMAAIKPPVH
ncbi:biliverdin-producing heme oxygenase [archaeon]|nr:MAG: biliverdin-producing heme oxygenase [archaeon]